MYKPAGMVTQTFLDDFYFEIICLTIDCLKLYILNNISL